MTLTGLAHTGALVLLVCPSACASQETVPEQRDVLAFDLIARGAWYAKANLDGSGVLAYELVRDRDDWSAFWEERFTGSAPDVDFSEHFVIAVFQGHQRTGGFGINILETAHDPGRGAIHVTLSTREPGAGEAVDLGETSPYEIVRIKAPAVLRQALERDNVHVAFYRRAGSTVTRVDVARIR